MMGKVIEAEYSKKNYPNFKQVEKLVDEME